MATKKRHTARKKKHGFLIFLIFAACAVCMIAAAKKLIETGLEYNNDPPVPSFCGYAEMGTADEDVLQALNSLADEDDRVQDVLAHINEFPEQMLALLVKNPEARDFVLDYPNHKGESGAGKISGAELDAAVPYFLQWDERWGYENYGSCVLGVTGCGPTCLSMVVVGLTGDSDATPSAVADFSEKSGFYVDGSGTSWELMTTGAASFGLRAFEVMLSEDSMTAELSAKHPLIINVGAGDFTDYGHFLVITGYENGMFIINDPNSPSKSSEGWYYTTLEPQIKNIWAYSAA